MTSLLRYLRSIHPLSEDFRDYLEDHLAEKNVSRKTVLLKQGQLCTNVYFVETGLFRSYSVYGQKKREKTLSFTAENGICTSFQSFSKRQPSTEAIEAIEDSCVWVLSYDQLQFIYQHFREAHQISRILMERCLFLKEQRINTHGRPFR